MRRIRRHTSLKLESLESRELLDGNVVSSIVGNTLILRGDVRANDLLIASDEAGALTITGLNGTNINGSSAPLAVGNAQNLVIDLKNGDNTLTIGPATPLAPDTKMDLPGNLAIKTGSGNDTIVLRNVRVPGALAISTGNKLDTVNVATSQIDGPAVIATGSGVDHVDLLSLAMVAATAADGGLVIDAGQGDDRIEINGLWGPPQALPGGGAGSPGPTQTGAAALLAIRSGTGHDDVHLQSVKVTDLVLDLHQGNDELFLHGGVNVSGRALIRGGPNKDTLVVTEETGGTPEAPTNVLTDATFIGVENADRSLFPDATWIGNNGRGPKFKFPRALA